MLCIHGAIYLAFQNLIKHHFNDAPADMAVSRISGMPPHLMGKTIARDVGTDWSGPYRWFVIEGSGVRIKSHSVTVRRVDLEGVCPQQCAIRNKNSSPLPSRSNNPFAASEPHV